MAIVIGLACGFNGDDGIIAVAALGEGCGICCPVGDVMLKLGWFAWPIGCGLAGVCGFELNGGVIGCWKRSPLSLGLCGARKALIFAL